MDEVLPDSSVEDIVTVIQRDRIRPLKILGRGSFGVVVTAYLMDERKEDEEKEREEGGGVGGGEDVRRNVEGFWVSIFESFNFRFISVTK